MINEIKKYFDNVSKEQLQKDIEETNYEYYKNVTAPDLSVVEMGEEMRKRLRESFHVYIGEEINKQMTELLSKKVLDVFNGLIEENPTYKSKVETEVSVTDNIINIKLNYKNIK